MDTVSGNQDHIERAAALLDELKGMRRELVRRIQAAKKKKAAHDASRKDLKTRYYFYVRAVREYMEAMREQGRPASYAGGGDGRPDRLQLPPEAVLCDEEDFRDILGVIVNPAYFPETGVRYDAWEGDIDMEQRDSWARVKQ